MLQDYSLPFFKCYGILDFGQQPEADRLCSSLRGHVRIESLEHLGFSLVQYHCAGTVQGPHFSVQLGTHLNYI